MVYDPSRELVLARPELRVGHWLWESSEVRQEWPSDPPSPAGLGRLCGEARGWGWVIYEPSPHPAPPVSLVFFALFPSLASNIAQGRFGNFRLLERPRRPPRGACPQDVGEALSAFTPAPPPRVGSRPAERD